MIDTLLYILVLIILVWVGLILVELAEVKINGDEGIN